MSDPNYYVSNLASKFGGMVALKELEEMNYLEDIHEYAHDIFDSLSPDMYFNNYYDFWQRLVKDEQKINLFNLKCI